MQGRTARTRPAVVLAGYVDQVARREQFERDHPDAQISHQAPVWTGSVLVGRTRREVTALGLGPLLGKLDALALLASELAALEAEYAGWRVWLSDLGRWWAVRQGPDGRWTRGRDIPVTHTADSAAGLRELLGAEAPELRRSYAYLGSALSAPLRRITEPGQCPRHPDRWRGVGSR